MAATLMRQRRGVMRASRIAAGGVLLALAPIALADTADSTARRVAEELAVNVCATCHGPGGISGDPMIPRIGGQQRDYIEVQLRAFRSKNRGDPGAHTDMWAVAATQNDAVIAALADYYATQPPSKGRFARRDAAQVAAGERLFRSGDRPRGIAACSACHGIDAEGMSVFPRLAGQNAPYLILQMQYIQERLRESPVMHGVIRDLRLEDMQALAYYLESL